jgi:hypothetical protein
MAKTEATKRAKVMRKEWWKSKSTKSSINELVGLGVLHARSSEAGECRTQKASPIPNPVRSLYSRISSRGYLGFLFILSSKAFAYTTRLGFAICIPTQPFSSPPSFIFVRLLEDFCHISISFTIFSIFGRRGPWGFSDR